MDSAGNAYVTGNTGSTDFPLAGSPLQTTLRGYGDAFVAKLNAAGSALVYSTYLGGSDMDAGWGIAVDSAGNAYVTGDTTSTDFPLAGSPLQTTLRGPANAFVAKLNAAGSALVYSTYLGGSGSTYPDYSVGDVGWGIAVDSAGNAYVTGGTRIQPTSRWREAPPSSPASAALSARQVVTTAEMPLWPSSIRRARLWSTPPTSAAAVTRLGLALRWTALATPMSWARPFQPISRVAGNPPQSSYGGGSYT